MEEISLHILDIAQNSIVADAKNITTIIEINEKQRLLNISINDDGKGMESEKLQQVSNPFYTSRSTRKVGLGIPLFKVAAEMTDGKFQMSSSVGMGTKVVASFHIDHMDRQPIGDVAGTYSMLISSYPNINFILELKNDIENFSISTNEIKEHLGDMNINDPEIIAFIREMIEERIVLLFGGKLNEIISGAR